MKISADGVYKLQPVSGSPTTGRSVIYTNGTMGAATVKLVYKDEDGNVQDYNDGAIAATPDETIVNHGVGMKVWVSVSGADVDTDLIITLAALKS